MKVTEIETAAARLRTAIDVVKTGEVHSKDTQEEIVAELLEAGLALVCGMLVNIAAIREMMETEAQAKSPANFGFEVGVSKGDEIKL